MSQTLSQAILASGGPAVVSLSKFSRPLQFIVTMDGEPLEASVSFRLSEAGTHFELWYIHADTAHGAEEWRIGRQQSMEKAASRRIYEHIKCIRNHILQMHSPQMRLVVLEDSPDQFFPVV